MAAEGWLAFLLVVLNLGNLAHPCDTQELRCQCIQMSSDINLLKFIKNVQVIPENIYCSRKEVIVLLKNGKLICLDPKAEWMVALIEKITHRPLNQVLHQKLHIQFNEEQAPSAFSWFERPLHLS